MVNNFSTIAYAKKIDKPWGYELILSSSDSPITSKILHLNSGARFSLQYHDQKEEVLTLVKGEAIIYLEDENGTLQELPMELEKGYFVKAMQKHRCKGITDCDILESSTPETGTTYRLEDDYNRPDETEELRKSQRTP
ncbi:cupin [Candidatus Microgenomates bacterium]|nr:cupin [Candidatus Microgenomates bacterium]